MVLLAAFRPSRSERACADEPTPEGAPSHTRGCSSDEPQHEPQHHEYQRHKERIGLGAARIGDELTAGREQLAFPGFAYAQTEEAGSSEAPLPAASAKASSSSTEPSSLTAEPAGSSAGRAHTARGADRSDNR